MTIDLRKPRLQPRDPHTPDIVNVLHSPKRIRVKFGGETVADSRDVLVLRSNHVLPVYFFPRAAVRGDLLQSSAHRARHDLGGDVVYWSLVAGGARAENAAWSFPNPHRQALAALRDHVAFDWQSVDQWFEEDEEVFVHARDPYARIDTLRSTSRVEIQLDGALIADTTRPVLLFETHLPTRFYIPHADVRLDRLVPSETRTRCPYKGIASYWSAKRADGSILSDVAWEYSDPIPEIPKIKGLIASIRTASTRSASTGSGSRRRRACIALARCGGQRLNRTAAPASSRRPATSDTWKASHG